MIPLTPKERAIKKTNQEIKKDISQLTKLAMCCGYGELQYFLYFLSQNRSSIYSSKLQKNDIENDNICWRNYDDLYKYLIGIVTKYCRCGYFENALDNTIINLELVHVMTKLALGINSKFETCYYLSIFENIEIFGERDQYFKINFEDVTKDERLMKFVNYNKRVGKENDLKKDNIMGKKEILIHFKEEFEPYSDLIMKEFHISLNEYTEFIDWITEQISPKIKSELDIDQEIKPNKYNFSIYSEILKYGSGLFLDKQKLEKRFGKKIDYVMTQLVFDSKVFNEYELKYALILRKPIIEKNEYYIISPEILLDSLFPNMHYTLLGSRNTKEEYKKRYSEIFVTKILEKAKNAGYKEFCRNLDLYEGNNQIGDIDIILKQENDTFVLIEAKCHTLPLDVYFCDFKALEDRLHLLINDWENKVKRRQNHLEQKFLNYGLGSNFKYLVVSKYPEIISHFSNFLFLSINEFDNWINANDLNKTFDSVFREIYEQDQKHLTSDQEIHFNNEFAPGWTFG